MIRFVIVVCAIAIVCMYPILLWIGVGAAATCFLTKYRIVKAGGEEDIRNRPSKNSRGFKTYQEVQAENIRRCVKPDYDPNAPENVARNKSINDLVEANRKKAEQEMKEAIEKEKVYREEKTVEQMMSEPGTK
jgi:MFS superfamily sulfate permease-like transporter